MKLLRIAGWAGAAIALVLLGMLARGISEAQATPIVRRATLELEDWPKGQPPLSVALLSDLHVGGLSRSPEAIRRIAAEVDALHPDLILIAGDFLQGSQARSAAEDERLMRPLSDLHARMGIVAVLGNHDYWGGDNRLVEVLERRGVTVLRNAVLRRGPLAIGGVDDPVTRHDQIDTVAKALRATPGARVVLAHSPELIEVLPPDLPLLLSGHTHCGQIRLPIIDPDGPPWLYGRYYCGLVRGPVHTVVVTAGLGTSLVPLRLGAPPDFWLITLGPKA